MAKLIAEQTVKHGGKYHAPGTEFDVTDKDEVAALVAAGAASKKTRTVEDDDEGTGDPATDSHLPASGATKAPGPNEVGAAAKAMKRP